MSTPFFSSSYDICGECLHSTNSHTEYNGIGKFMYCGSCMKLCEKEQFIIKNNPSSIDMLVKLQIAREFAPYKPKEHGKDLTK